MTEWKLAAGPGSIITPAEISGDTLRVSAIIAKLSAVDRDGDTYSRGAFGGASDVVISRWNHSAMSTDLASLPVGQGRIDEIGDEAVFTGEVWLDTEAGRDVAKVLSRRGARQQWSYGFNILASEPVTIGNRRVRRLIKLNAFEVSPVILGAGIGTRTLGLSLSDEEAAIVARAHQHVDDHAGREALQAAHLRLIATGMDR